MEKETKVIVTTKLAVTELTFPLPMTNDELIRLMKSYDAYEVEMTTVYKKDPNPEDIIRRAMNEYMMKAGLPKSIFVGQELYEALDKVMKAKYTYPERKTILTYDSVTVHMVPTLTPWEVVMA